MSSRTKVAPYTGRSSFQRGCMSYLPRGLSRTTADGRRISWQADLRRLCQARLSDAQVARLLSQLHPSHPVSPWKVWYHRQQLQADVEDLPPSQRRRLANNRYQIERGLGGLLPDADHPIGPRWRAGIELTPRQVDLLCCLRDAGPLGFDDLAGRLGIRSAWLSELLSVLVFLQLVRRYPERGRCAARGGRYRLASSDRLEFLFDSDKSQKGALHDLG